MTDRTATENRRKNTRRLWRWRTIGRKKRKTAVEQGDEAEVQRAKGRVDELYAKIALYPVFPGHRPYV